MTNRPTIANRPSNNAPCITLGTNLQGEDLGGIEPRDSKPGRTKNHGVQEDEKGCGATDMRLARRVGGVESDFSKSANKEAADSLAGSSPVQSPAATDPIKGEDTDKSGKLHTHEHASQYDLILTKIVHQLPAWAKSGLFQCGGEWRAFSHHVRDVV